MARKRLAMLPAAALAAVALTACSPEIKGYTGISVDTTGRASAEIVWCDPGSPESVMLFRDSDADNSPTTWPEWPGRDYPLPPGATSPATVPLTDFPTDPTVLSMYAASEFTTRRVTFTVAELAQVPSGSILITEVQEGEERQRTVTRDEFAHLADDLCG
ncbi:hypothetical protein [Asanoa iriomotensis]|nr:hypothetical protein [Asanoa iriomotensis]